MGDTEHILYTVKVDDDPEHPVTIWSFLETDNELRALQQIIKNGRCSICLFNEGAINVCHADTVLTLDTVRATAMVSRARLPAVGELSRLRELATTTLELPMADRAKAVVVKPGIELYLASRTESLPNQQNGEKRPGSHQWR